MQGLNTILIDTLRLDFCLHFMPRFIAELKPGQEPSLNALNSSFLDIAFIPFTPILPILCIYLALCQLVVVLSCCIQLLPLFCELLSQLSLAIAN